MNVVNEIIFNKKDFENEEMLFKKMGQQLQLLMDTNNVCTVRKEELDSDVLYIINFAINVPEAFQPYPYFLYPDEAGYVSMYVAKKSLIQYQMDTEQITESINEAEEKVILFDKKKKKKDEDDLN